MIKFRPERAIIIAKNYNVLLKATTMNTLQLEIGTAGQTLPVEKVLGSRGLLFGKSGSGKSTTANVLADELLKHNLPVYFIDPDGEHIALKSEHPVLHIGNQPECDKTVAPDAIPDLVPRLVADNVPAVLDVSAYDPEETDRAIELFARALFDVAKSEQKPLVVFVDEIDEHAPTLKKTAVSEALVTIMKRGRKHGLGIIGMSQRPADVTNSFITQSEWVVWHRMTWNADIDTAREHLPKSLADRVRNFTDGEVALVTDWQEIQHIQIRPKRTPDLAAAPEIDTDRLEIPSSLPDDLLDNSRDPDALLDHATPPAEQTGPSLDHPSLQQYVSDIQTELESMDETRQQLLDYLRQRGEAHASEAYQAVGGPANTAYAHQLIGGLHDQRYVQKTGQATFRYALPDRVRFQLRYHPDADAATIDDIVAQLEDTIRGMAATPSGVERLATVTVGKPGRDDELRTTLTATALRPLGLGPDGTLGITITEDGEVLGLPNPSDDKDVLLSYSVVGARPTEPKCQLSRPALELLCAGDGDHITAIRETEPDATGTGGWLRFETVRSGRVVTSDPILSRGTTWSKTPDSEIADTLRLSTLIPEYLNLSTGDSMAVVGPDPDDDEEVFGYLLPDADAPDGKLTAYTVPDAGRNPRLRKTACRAFEVRDGDEVVVRADAGRARVEPAPDRQDDQQASSGQVKWEFSEADVLEAVRTAIEDGRRDGLNGGIAPPVLTDYLPVQQESAKQTLNWLVEDGSLVSVKGVSPSGDPRTSYLPADHPDASSDWPDSEFPRTEEAHDD